MRKNDSCPLRPAPHSFLSTSPISSHQWPEGRRVSGRWRLERGGWGGGVTGGGQPRGWGAGGTSSLPHVSLTRQCLGCLNFFPIRGIVSKSSIYSLPTLFSHSRAPDPRFSFLLTVRKPFTQLFRTSSNAICSTLTRREVWQEQPRHNPSQLSLPCVFSSEPGNFNNKEVFNQTDKISNAGCQCSDCQWNSWLKRTQYRETPYTF